VGNSVYVTGGTSGCGVIGQNWRWSKETSQKRPAPILSFSRDRLSLNFPNGSSGFRGPQEARRSRLAGLSCIANNALTVTAAVPALLSNGAHRASNCQARAFYL